MPEFDSTIEYRDVPGFPGYKVGNDGSVWSAWHQFHAKGHEGKITRIGNVWSELKPQAKKRGYRYACLCAGKKKFYPTVHRLVLLAFVGPRPDGMEVCHFPDRNPANNRLENLIYGTKLTNNSHMRIHKTDQRGERSGMAKLTWPQIEEIRARRRNGETIVKIGKAFGIAHNHVSRICLGKCWVVDF